MTQNVSIVPFQIMWSVFNPAGAKKSATFRFILPGIVMTWNQNYVQSNLIFLFKSSKELIKRELVCWSPDQASWSIICMPYSPWSDLVVRHPLLRACPVLQTETEPGIATMTLPCCENNTWASASRGTWGSSGAPGMDCRKEIIFCSKEAVLIWWICSMPRTDAKNYFSTCEYFLSATESAPLLYVTGWPCCISKKPNPSLDASSCPPVWSLLLK